MGLPPLRYPQISTFTESDRRELRFIASPTTGVGTGTVTNAAAPIRCNETEVALIDEVSFTCMNFGGAAADQTVSLMINGRTSGELGATSSRNPHQCNFHFMGAASGTLQYPERMAIQPRGNMVVSPSSTLWVKSSSTFSHCHIKYRQKRLSKAIADGDIKPNGGIPQVASTNSVSDGTGDGTVAATAKAIIAANTAGQGIEILGIYLTGHNMNAAADDIRLGFWDGATGTFTANGNIVFRGWAQGANRVFQPRVLIDDTRGCIQSATGSVGVAANNGLYIQASANLAGATPKADYVVMYRTINVAEAPTTGALGLTPTVRKKWWCYSQAAASASVDPFFADPGLTSETGKQMLRIHGHAFSVTANNGGTGNIGIQWSDNSGPAYLGEICPVTGDGTAATVSTSHARVGINSLIKLNQVPGFLADNGAITNKAQLAWGTFGASSDTGSRATLIAG